MAQNERVRRRPAGELQLTAVTDEAGTGRDYLWKHDFGLLAPKSARGNKRDVDELKVKRPQTQ